MYCDHFGVFGPNLRVGLLRIHLHTTGLGPVGVRPSQAPPPVGAVPYVPPLCEGGFRGYPPNPTLGFCPFLRSRSCTLPRRTFSSGPLWWTPEGVVYLRKATSAVVCLVTLYFVVLLSFLHTTRRGLPLQGPSSGHSMAYRLSSRTTQTTSQLASSGIARSSSWSSSSRIKEDMCGERGSSVNVLLCLVLCLLFVVLCWPGPFSGHVSVLSPSLCACYVGRYAAGVVLARRQNLSADLLKRGR